jgi:hypothetical protein
VSNQKSSLIAPGSGPVCQPDYRRRDDSIPLLLIAAVTPSDERNPIGRLEASTCFDPATMAAA